MNTPNQDMLEVFLQEASEHLQFLREYSSVLQDPYPAAQDLERLYVAAHTLVGSSGLYQFKLFAEVASKLAHIFQYAINAGISQEASGPLVEFIYEGIAVLESDLLMVSTNGVESEDEFQGFREKYPYAFQSTEAAKEPEPVAAPDPERHPMPPASWEPEPLVHEAHEQPQVALPTFDEPSPVVGGSFADSRAAGSDTACRRRANACCTAAACCNCGNAAESDASSQAGAAEDSDPGFGAG